MSQNRGRGNKQVNRGRGGKQNANRNREEQPQQPVFAPPKNYGAPENIKAAELEQQKIAERLKQNEQLAEAAKSKPPAPRKAEYIEEGKQILSSFFNGFNNLERSNVEVELDHSLGNRLSSFYHESIENNVDSKYLGTDTDEDIIEAKKTEKIRIFNSVVNMAIAIKLGKSGTDLDKKRFKGISVLTSPSPISLPKKLSVIINQLGKTDLPNDNKLRIVEQGLVAKQMLVRGVFNYFNEAKTKSYLIEYKNDDPGSSKYTWKNLKALISNDRNLRVMIDDHSNSVDFLQHFSKFRFEEFRKDKTFDVTWNSLTIKVSLPYFDFKAATEDSIVEYLDNPLFTGSFKDSKLVPQIVAIVTTPLLEVNHIRKPNQKLGELFGKFKNSFLANVTIQDLFDVLKVWNINRFISDNDLDDLSTYVYESYQTGGRNYFSKFLDLQEINFTNFGTDAQLVEIDNKFITQDSDKFKKRERTNYGQVLNRIKGKAKALCKFKISETGAIFGSSVKFNNGVKYLSDYEVQFTGKNKDVLSEFIKKDFLK